MSMHDWTRVPAGLFHDFHQSWSIRIKDALNAGRLPKGRSALVERRAGPREADVLTVERSGAGERPATDTGRGLLITDRPAATIVRRTVRSLYAGRANRIVVRHHLGRIVAVIEIISPGNKDSRLAIGEFVEKVRDFLRKGVHLLLADLFPPTARDPHGMHKLVWDELVDEDFTFPAGKDRILASYEMGLEQAAYVEPLGVGDAQPDMPLFLLTGMHVTVPLEATYDAAWDASPEELRTAVTTGVLPEFDVCKPAFLANSATAELCTLI